MHDININLFGGRPLMASQKTVRAAGIALICLGGLIMADRYLHSGWVNLLVLPLAGLLVLAVGAVTRRMAFIVLGGLAAGIGAGTFVALASVFSHLLFSTRLGLLLICGGIGWGLMVLVAARYTEERAWWALVPGSLFAAVGLWLVISPLKIPELVFYVGVGLGLSLLAWGAATRLIGLVIPGALLTGLGPGLYLGWNSLQRANPLAGVGVVLVCFAMGWGLITVMSRAVNGVFIWWPLIPGGILAMTGWGLYIGGNPGNAIGFISNTGSIGLILFGVYLLLWRTGLRK